MAFKVAQKIPGTPTFANMIELRKQLGTNLIAVDCPWGQGKVQMGLLQYPTNFTVWNGRPYDPPTQQPPIYPNIHSGTSKSDRERMHAKKIEDQRNWKTYKHCERICIKQMAEAIESMYYTELGNPDKTRNGINIYTF